MERIKSLGNWLIILLLLIGTAVFAVVWPFIAQSLNFGGFGALFGGATRPTVNPAQIVLPLPAPIASVVGQSELLLTGLAAFAALAAIVVGSVVAAGLVITVLMRLGDKFTTQVAQSKEYQTHVSALEQKETEKLKAKRASQPATPQPEAYVYGLDPISYSLLILFFVGLLTSLTFALISPEGEMTLFGQTFYSAQPLLLVSFIITIPLLAWRVRRKRLEAVADKDYGPIPWDFIAVLVLGLLVVGVGLGLMLFFNRPV